MRGEECVFREGGKHGGVEELACVMWPVMAHWGYEEFRIGIVPVFKG